MSGTEKDLSPTEQVETARKAFEQEFERFVRFTDDANGVAGLTLEQAIAEERALGEIRTRHLGKKSALAGVKKLIGKVPAEERSGFGQLVQAAETEVVSKLNLAEGTLKQLIEAERTARSTLIGSPLRRTALPPAARRARVRNR